MKIGGFGELESIRKAIQKDGTRAKPAPAESAPVESQTRTDAVQISDQAKVLGKLRQIPDLRQEEIEKALAKLNDGTLMTPEAVKESMAKMLENLLE